MLFTKRWAKNTGVMPPPLTRHLYIAGTGRAGTSFLVKYLTAVGMDTSLARGGRNAYWSKSANAGLEERPDRLVGPDVPYVVKSPWLYLAADDLVATAADRIDGLIVPVRDLSHAAQSRIANERQEIRAGRTWGAKVEPTLDVWNTTAGGALYSLQEVDQMRLLAVGFHALVERFVAADLPIVFLHFPRSVRDANYLIGKLRPFLPADLTMERARAAFLETADESKVHFG